VNMDNIQGIPRRMSRDPGETGFQGCFHPWMASPLVL